MKKKFNEEAVIVNVAKKNQTIFVDEIFSFMTKKNMNEIFAWNLDCQGAEMDVIARKKMYFQCRETESS